MQRSDSSFFFFKKKTSISVRKEAESIASVLYASDKSGIWGCVRVEYIGEGGWSAWESGRGVGE